MTEDVRSPLAGVRVTIVEGDASRVVELPNARVITIGRTPECDIVLATRRASREHARIIAEDDRIVVADTGSANGTLLNGVKVERQVLFDGDVLSIGEARITFGERAPAERLESDESVPVLEAVEPARAPRFRRAASFNRVAALFVLVWCAGLIGAGAWWSSEGFPLPGFLDFDAAPDEPTAGRADATPRGARAAARNPRAGVRAAASPRVPAAPGMKQTDTDEIDAVVAALDAETPAPGVTLLDSEVGDILDALSTGRARWEAVDELERRLAADPLGAHARFLERLVPVLAGLRDSTRRDRLAAAESSFDRLVADKRYGEAALVARFLAALEAADETQRERWLEKAAALDGVARAEFAALETELSRLNESGRSLDALRALVDVKSRYAGLEFYDELLPRYVEAGTQAASAVVRDEDDRLTTPEALRLADQVAVAFEACRFDELPALLYSLLALGPSRGERVALLEGLVRARALAAMLEEFRAKVAEAPLRVSPYEGFTGRTLAVTAEGVEYELDIDGREAAHRDTAPWSKITTLRKYELFRSVPLSPDAALGLALFAFHTGHDEGAHAALIRLRNREGQAALADAVLATHLGESVPEGGYVEHFGRLVRPEFRDADLARRREAAEEERTAQAELRRLKRESTLGAYLALARKYRERGLFKLAHSILVALATKVPDTDAGTTAAELVRDPMLLVDDVAVTGPAENRLDIFFLGEGYPIDDDSQRAFDYRVQAALGLLLKEDPYREYESYFNFRKVHLGSKDRGVDRVPGEVSRDTPLGGAVRWDTFTVERYLVVRILERVGPGGSDGQAVVIGNDYAGVATGGSGVSSISKVSLVALAHELGHSLGGLHDEYDFVPGNDPQRRLDNVREENVPTAALPPNLMIGSDRDDVLKQAIWREWIDVGPRGWWAGSKVEVFEGGGTRRFNYWRPQATCKMRTSTARFCVVCMEHMVKRIYLYVRPIDRVEPTSDEVVLRERGLVQLSVWPMKPRSRFLEATWTIAKLPPASEGRTVVATEAGDLDAKRLETVGRRFDPQGRPVEFAALRHADLEPGAYRVTVTVRDTTPWVIRDPEGSLQQQHAWRVLVRSPLTPRRDRAGGGSQ